MRNKAKYTVLALALLLAAASTLYAGGGTGLAVTLAFDPLVDLVCDNGQGTVTIHYTAGGGNSADGATVNYTVMTNPGGVEVQAGSLPSIAEGTTTDTPAGDWVNDKGTKTYSDSFNLTLSNGTYDIEVCVDQSGATERKHACGTITVTVDCQITEETCDKGNVIFGEVVGNKNVCKASNVVNFQFAGLYGPTATVDLSGPGGFHKTFYVDRAGDSCNYHLLWQATGDNGGAGNYTLAVSGNGNSESYDVALQCKK